MIVRQELLHMKKLVVSDQTVILKYLAYIGNGELYPDSYCNEQAGTNIGVGDGGRLLGDIYGESR